MAYKKIQYFRSYRNCTYVKRNHSLAFTSSEARHQIYFQTLRKGRKMCIEERNNITCSEEITKWLGDDLS